MIAVSHEVDCEDGTKNGILGEMVNPAPVGSSTLVSQSTVSICLGTNDGMLPAVSVFYYNSKHNTMLSVKRNRVLNNHTNG